MSRRRLPPLTSLRAFEAAARHSSFDKAGDEIAVTASAVGQQVKALEAWLGVPLFLRLPSRGVVLTAAGERYASTLTDLLDRLHEATARAMKADHEWVLTVSTIPSFALLWLIPRLGSLRQQYPEMEIRVSVSPLPVDFAREDVDAAIRLGRGHYPGLRTDWLMDETFFAVCSDALLTDPARPLREPADLRHHTLLHEIAEGIPNYTTWARWLAEIGATGIDTSRGPHFSHTFMVLQAAASGQGVALATNVLIGDYLKAGRLARPFPQEVSGVNQYHVVCPEASAERPAISAFRNWLLDEARAAR
ncbi:transcriptional regulator GcvA [Microvirga pudoricolor]|uniref:transcriptional regulator GcvA n=1 Tax=Microvirga pudoricolor TaxID=2778729 RepID=UPI00194EDEFB|nr:transcriptional regulator GcvA [Microvirga pudoricolor]MBM6595729.1 transcriptional regulator GcvA [Microvirga pudoricolor]